MKAKKNIEALISYKVNPLQVKIKLDANEAKNYLFDKPLKSTVFPMHLYPDNDMTELKAVISNKMNVEPTDLIIGNGSSEILELVVKSYVDKDEVILSFDPSFSMYKVYAQIHGANFIEVPSEEDFSLNMETMKTYALKYQPKLVFLCTPNNPTGYQIPKDEVIDFIKSTDALVVVDEAYMEFASNDTSIFNEAKNFPNVIVARTFSKAFGLAAARIGYATACKDIINVLNSVKPPYNVNTLSQYYATQAMKKFDLMEAFTNEIKTKRLNIAKALKKLGVVCYDSEANFIFFKGCPHLYKALIDKDIMIRAFSGNLFGYFRVTIGNDTENEAFINAMEAIINETR
ncbi:MAG: histidinol-phosphate transaminase [Candidatus Izemoplasmataceae bacterium]